MHMFDIITAHDVIEHLIDPSLELERMFQRLRDGGYLVIEQPDPSSYQAKAGGLAWKHIKPREHLFLMSPQNFDRFLILQLGMTKIAQWTPLPGRFAAVYRKVSKMSENEKPEEKKPCLTSLSDMPRTEQEFGAGTTEVTTPPSDTSKNG